MRQNDEFPVQDASVNANAIVNVDFSYILFKCYLSLFRMDKHSFSALRPTSETVQS